MMTATSDSLPHTHVGLTVTVGHSLPNISHDITPQAHATVERHVHTPSDND